MSGPAEDVGRVGVLGHQAQRLLLAAAADHDRHPRPADRLRGVQQPAGGIPGPVEATPPSRARPATSRGRSGASPPASRSVSRAAASGSPARRSPPGSRRRRCPATPGRRRGRRASWPPSPTARAAGSGRPPTMSPRRARLVWAAMNPSVVQPSSIGSSAGPIPRIWKKWSITQRESNPASSALRAIRASVGPMAGVPPAQLKRLIWRPIFMGRSPLRCEPDGVASGSSVSPSAASAGSSGGSRRIALDCSR